MIPEIAFKLPDKFHNLSNWITRHFVNAGNAANAYHFWHFAIVAYKGALFFNENLPEIWVQLGHMLKERRDLDASEAAYWRASQIDPSHFDAWFWWAQMGHRHEPLQTDIQRFAKVLGHFRDNPPSSEVDRKRYSELLLIYADRLYTRVHRALYERPVKPEYQFNLNTDLEETVKICEIGLGIDPNCENLRLLALRAQRLKAARAGSIPDCPSVMTSLRYLIFGTTGRCNASCIHCPTGKPETNQSPRFEMPLSMFEKIVEGLHLLNLSITDQVSFGLFGDGLVDKYVVERARIFRQYYPRAHLVVNTNGAAFNLAKHRPLLEYNVHVGLHVESLNATTYETLMAPLRFENVKPKIEQILECFRGRVNVSVPVSRLNVAELPAIRDYFFARGVNTVAFDPLFNRCRDDNALFNSLALQPGKVACTSDVLDDLIIDCDGTVLMCCQDFQRKEPIGNFNDQNIIEVLTATNRFLARKRFAAKEYQAYGTCSNCYAGQGDHLLGRVFRRAIGTPF